MKCINCETDNNWLDRLTNSGRCQKCQHPFVFDPEQKYTDLVTDELFARSIDNLSDNGNCCFTTQQLFYFLDKNLRQTNSQRTNSTLIVVIFLTLLGLAIGIFPLLFPDYVRPQEAYTIPAILLILLAAGIGVFKFSAIATGSETNSVSENQFQEWLARWQAVNDRTLEKLLPYSTEETLLSQIEWQGNPESFQRIIICDRPEVAQLLIANQFPLETSCAVCHFDAYRWENWKRVKEAIERYSNVKIYALHGATPEGVSLIFEVIARSDLMGLAANVKVYDLGLLPRQVLKNPHIAVQNSEESSKAAKNLLGTIRQNLLMKELNWLEQGNFVELEYFSYPQLREIIVKGMESDRPTELEKEVA
jgi:hypothetical protein